MPSESLIDALRAAHLDVTPDAPLARLTTLRVGGAAALLASASDTPQVVAALRHTQAAASPLWTLGMGSNLLVPDEGFEGVVLRLCGALRGIESIGDDGRVVIGAGMPNAQAVRRLQSEGWVGAECVALVPGSLGGAVAMNAGTRHGELSEVLEAVEVADADGGRWLDADALAMGYRSATLPPGGVVTRVALRLARGDVGAAKTRVREEKNYRSATQPFQLATSGSIFRNPPGDHAGRLIEVAGLKGERCGGAVISPMHANWIVNEGGAAARDILTLMARARTRVHARDGVWLRPEVRLLSVMSMIEALAPYEAAEA